MRQREIAMYLIKEKRKQPLIKQLEFRKHLNQATADKPGNTHFLAASGYVAVKFR
jgi:hypothetical protein